MAEIGLVDCEILTREEAAKYIRNRWKQRVSAQTLSTYASRGEGPEYSITKTRSGAFYLKSDIDRWAVARYIPGKIQAA